MKGEEEKGGALREDYFGAALNKVGHSRRPARVGQAAIDPKGWDEAKRAVKGPSSAVAGIGPIRAKRDVFAADEVLAPVFGLVVVHQATFGAVSG